MDIVGVKVADIFLCVSVSIHVFFFAHTATREQTRQRGDQKSEQCPLETPQCSVLCSGNAASSDSAIMFQRHLASETFSLLCRRGAVCCLPRPGGN